MSNEVLLLVTNGGLIFSGILAIIISSVVLIKGKDSLTNRLYFLTNLLFVVYCVIFFFGINTPDPILSRSYLMFSLVNLFTVTVNAHFIWNLIGIGDKMRYVTHVIYVMATIILAFFILNPDKFLIPSRSILYLPNYFNPGSYYLIFVVFFAVVAVFFLGTLVFCWLRAKGNDRNRILYVLIAFLWAYTTGSIAFLPIFGINADPLYSSFVGLYTIPIAYSILTYKLMDLHIIAARAIKFSLFTVLAGLLVVLANTVGNYASTSIDGFPSWLVPLVSGILVVGIGFVVMRRLRETDALKYEFINNISHKFRTPLTHIRWLSEELRDESDQKLRDGYVEQIQYASMRLFELTNIVIDVAEDAEADYPFRRTAFSLMEVTDNLIKSHNDQLEKKHIKVVVNDGRVDSNIPEVNADKTRLQFAMQILFENAIIYTHENGQIKVGVEFNRETGEFVFSVTDNGIGIDSEDLPKLFSKFYRTVSARHTDTEGMGIGLYMAKKIVMKHGGRILVQSDGENRGSTFSFAIPLKS